MIAPREALAALLEPTRMLTHERPLEESLQVITDTALRLLPGNHASVRLLDESRTTLVAGARSGEGAVHRPLSFHFGEGVAGWVAEHDELARLDDVALDPRFKRATDQGFAIASILTVPLRSAGKVVGVLSVSARDLSAFTPEDELLARLLANCAVPPIEKARLERLAITDHHTRAFNQRHLLPCLYEEIARARRTGVPLSLLLMDLDHFKRVNDRHGHAAGDVVLRGFADRVREQVRRGDVLVRRGGEEFVLIMPACRPDEAHQVAERIRTQLEQEPLAAGEGVRVHQTVSIGLATWDGNETPEELHHRADLAMYEAKHRGRNQVVLHSSLG